MVKCKGRTATSGVPFAQRSRPVNEPVIAQQTCPTFPVDMRWDRHYPFVGGGGGS